MLIPGLLGVLYVVLLITPRDHLDQEEPLDHSIAGTVSVDQLEEKKIEAIEEIDMMKMQTDTGERGRGG